MSVDQTRLSALEAEGCLTEAETRHATALLEKTGEPLDQVLTQLGLLTEDFLGERFAREAGVSFDPEISRRAIKLPVSMMDEVNPDFLLAQRVLPLAAKSGRVEIAVVDPSRETGPRGLAFALNVPIDLVVTTSSQFNQVFRDQYGDGEGLANAGGQLDISADSDRLKDLASAAPVVRLVNQLITMAAEQRASDIHIEPGARDAVVRFRVDGVLRDVETLPLAQSLAVISRIKVLAELDIAERRRAQDGRFSIPVAGRSIDLRVSVVPAQHGESLVVRLLDPEAALHDMSSLGFTDQVAEVARHCLSRPNGLVLITGPTGSGKTTSLYAFLRQLADGERKILTIEDPIEYRLAGIAQSQTNPLIGVTFASALRSFLRHDPDVVMVGEIRDSETAQTAVQAAMTGHLVLSTLHTNDAPSAIVRLMDMGVEDYLLSSTLVGVFGQRLVRRTCEACGGAGCEGCQGTGFFGRVALAEAFAVDDELRSVIKGSADQRQIAAALGHQQFVPMSVDGKMKSNEGLTSDEEVHRALGRGLNGGSE
jgi:general secretion pathway protein E